MTGEININVCNEIFNSIEELEAVGDNKAEFLNNSDSNSNENIYDKEMINNIINNYIINISELQLSKNNLDVDLFYKNNDIQKRFNEEENYINDKSYENTNDDNLFNLDDIKKKERGN